MHELSDFFGHVLGRLLLLEEDSLLFASISGQSVHVEVSRLELLNQLCDEDGRPDVVEGQDVDVSSVSDAS